MSKKLVFKLQVHDERAKKKALKSVSSLSEQSTNKSWKRIESLAMDMNEKKLTLVGDVDPVEVVCKLKKNWHIELLTVGPAKEPEKKEEKKEEPKKEEKKMTESEKIEELLKLYKSYNPYCTQYYPIYSVEEYPNSCVIC